MPARRVGAYSLHTVHHAWHHPLVYRLLKSETEEKTLSLVFIYLFFLHLSIIPVQQNGPECVMRSGRFPLRLLDLIGLC